MVDADFGVHGVQGPVVVAVMPDIPSVGTTSPNDHDRDHFVESRREAVDAGSGGIAPVTSLPLTIFVGFWAGVKVRVASLRVVGSAVLVSSDSGTDVGGWAGQESEGMGAAHGLGSGGRSEFPVHTERLGFHGVPGEE